MLGLYTARRDQCCKTLTTRPQIQRLFERSREGSKLEAENIAASITGDTTAHFCSKFEQEMPGQSVVRNGQYFIPLAEEPQIQRLSERSREGSELEAENIAASITGDTTAHFCSKFEQEMPGQSVVRNSQYFIPLAEEPQIQRLSERSREGSELEAENIAATITGEPPALLCTKFEQEMPGQSVVRNGQYFIPLAEGPQIQRLSERSREGSFERAHLADIFTGSFISAKDKRGNSASRYQSLYCRSCNRYPYVSRISVGEENRVDFIYQFVKKSFVAEYHSNPNLFYNAPDIIGIPTQFPNCVTRTDNFDVSISPWQDKVSSRLQNYLSYDRTMRGVKANNYIDIEFHEAVYPIRVSIYEIYRPVLGRVFKLWAQDSDNQWFPLWNGSLQIVPPISRLFSPPLQSCNFKTKRLRLEFEPCTWDYVKLDAVMLIGTSELILSRNPKESLTDLLNRISCMYSLHEDGDNLTADYKSAHLDIVYLQDNFTEYCTILESDMRKTLYKSNLGHKRKFLEVNSHYVRPSSYRYLHRLLSQDYLCHTKHMKLSADKFKKLSHYNLTAIPNEIILKILKNLDLISLCCMNQINKRFNNLTREPRLYTRLNVRSVRYRTYSSNIFWYFTPRCKYLQQLDLTSSNFFVKDFVQFLDYCGKHLTHLKLSKCYQLVNEDVLLKISQICKNLKELDLKHCFIVDKAFSYLEDLKSLEHLNLCNTQIKAQRLCKILQKNQRMRKLNLKFADTNLDAVAIQLRNSCSNLEVINLCDAYITWQGINALAECKNLRRVNLQTRLTIADDSLCRFFSSCQYLEEVHLSNIILTDHNLKLLSQCRNLEQLHLKKVELVTPDKYSIIFKQCPKLQKFYFIFCKISTCLINQWKERYPHVSVYSFH